MRPLKFKVSLLHIVFFLSISLEGKNTIQKFEANRNKFIEFKKNMTVEQWNYYLPRKKYIDKQPIKSSKNYLSQADIIIKGSVLRENCISNRKEILELEDFLTMADDLELNKYFSLSEEILLEMKAKNVILSIARLAKEDENWRKKNDPIFIDYIQNAASIEEKIFYKKNKALFFRSESGEKLILFLKSKTSRDFSA